jgi:hypothetical protein
MARDANGRFLPKLGAPLRPDSPGDGKVVVVPPSAPAPADEWDFNIASLGLTIDLSAEIVVDAMSRAGLMHIRRSLIEGKRPDGGGAQKALGAKAAAGTGRQSPFRGYKTGHLADHIRRSRIKGDTSKASCRIVPPPDPNVYVAEELKRGVVLLSADGAAGEAMRAAARAVVAAACTGREVIHDDGDVDANDA